MPDTETRPLGQLCQLVNGRAFKPSDWGKSGLPIVRIQNLNDEAKPFNYFDGEYRKSHFIDDGQILLSWSGTPGTSFGCFRWRRGAALLNQHIFKVLTQDEIDSDFFICAVNSKLDEMIRQAHGGVGLRHITKTKLQAIRLPVPSLAEQRRIVARIKECMERVEEIEGLRQESTKDVYALQSAVFADYVEGLPDAATGKTVVGDVLANCKYGTSTKANTIGEGCPVLRMGNIQNGRLDTSDLKHIALPQKERVKYLLNNGDILINRTNSLELVGKSAVFENLPGEWVYASYLIRLRVDADKAIPEYVNAIINSRIGRSYVYRTARRAIGMVNINAQEIKQMPMPLPPLDEQQAVVDQMHDTEPLIDELWSTCNGGELGHLRASILRKAFAGEL